MEYTTREEGIMDSLASACELTVVPFNKDSIQDEWNCPKCGQLIYMVEEGGPESTVIRASDMEWLSNVKRMITNGTKNGSHLILDITLCDCGEPVYVRSWDEGYTGAKYGLSNMDFCPEEHSINEYNNGVKSNS